MKLIDLLREINKRRFILGLELVQQEMFIDIVSVMQYRGFIKIENGMVTLL